jgi:hypothetical protein
MEDPRTVALSVPASSLDPGIWMKGIKLYGSINGVKYRKRRRRERYNGRKVSLRNRENVNNGNAEAGISHFFSEERNFECGPKRYHCCGRCFRDIGSIVPCWMIEIPE